MKNPMSQMSMTRGCADRHDEHQQHQKDEQQGHLMTTTNHWCPQQQRQTPRERYAIQLWFALIFGSHLSFVSPFFRPWVVFMMTTMATLLPPLPIVRSCMDLTKANDRTGNQH